MEEFDLEKARFDVHKFGIKGFEKSKYQDARIALAVSLGAKVNTSFYLFSSINFFSSSHPNKNLSIIVN